MTADTGPARIGPNAIIRVAEALRASQIDPAPIFARAGLMSYLTQPPEQMVPEDEVIALHRALRAILPPAQAAAVAQEAGRRTGDYLLAHRIPWIVQLVLRSAPPRWASRVLLTAIGRNAWTFVGSGHYRFESGRSARIVIASCPLCRAAASTTPLCAFYTGAFQRLGERLISARLQASETACQALGAPACVFELHW